MIRAGCNLRISSIEEVHASTAENTCCSRMRRAISWVYCPPKSRTTTPPSSALILPPCSGACFAAVSIMPSPLSHDDIQYFVGHENALYDTFAGELRHNHRIDLRPFHDLFFPHANHHFRFITHP